MSTTSCATCIECSPLASEVAGITGETSTCSQCGSVLQETVSGTRACVSCLIRVGIEDEQAAPDRFGDFEINRREDGSLDELGRGAMGVTYRATDTALDRQVALKVVQNESAMKSATARERFVREARAAAALRHENIATVFQFGVRKTTGECFYAMELVEGETLEQRVRRTGPLDAPTVIAIAQQITAALIAAEQRGLIHRDLKPANVMLIETPDGRVSVRVIDFGLAKAVAEAADPMSATSHGFVGTPAFASPEQFAGAALDVRSDVYSLGATLWFALTGQRPFAGKSPAEIQRAQETCDLSLGELRSARVPRRLLSLLCQMLAREPAARPGVQELEKRLRALATERPVRRYASFATALLLFAGVGLTTYYWAHHRAAIGTTNPGAYVAYQKGTYFWNKRTADGYAEAEKHFRKAVELDPAFAKAWVGLGNVLQFAAIYHPEFYREAEMALRKAVQLDPDLPETHTGLGLLAMNYYWDWTTAEKEFKRAIELDPKFATGHQWYAELLTSTGRFDESLREAQRARELDPTSIIINSDIGKYLFYARRYEEAEEQFKEIDKMDSHYPEALNYFAFTCSFQNKHAKALEIFSRIDDQSGAGYLSALSFLYARAGDQEKAREQAEEARRRCTSTSNSSCQLLASLALGDNERALDLLERDYACHYTTMTALAVSPIYDPLRSEPRFADLLRRVHLAR